VEATGVSHSQPPRIFEGQGLIEFIRDSWNAAVACAGAFDVATLDHEALDDPVEGEAIEVGPLHRLAALVQTLRFAARQGDKFATVTGALSS